MKRRDYIYLQFISEISMTGPNDAFVESDAVSKSVVNYASP